MAKRSVQSVEAADRRWSDKLLGGMAVIIGAMSAIIWGIIWTQVASTTVRVATLEGDKRVIETKLDEMKNQLNRIEIRMERGNEAENK